MTTPNKPFARHEVPRFWPSWQSGMPKTRLADGRLAHEGFVAKERERKQERSKQP